MKILFDDLLGTNKNTIVFICFEYIYYYYCISYCVGFYIIYQFVCFWETTEFIFVYLYIQLRIYVLL